MVADHTKTTPRFQVLSRRNTRFWCINLPQQICGTGSGFWPT